MRMSKYYVDTDDDYGLIVGYDGLPRARRRIIRLSAELQAVDDPVDGVTDVSLTPRYLGNVGQRSYVPDDTGVGFGLLNFMSISKHYAADDIPAGQIAIPNFAGATEAGPGSATTVTAAIEFETGMFFKCTFAGAASGSIANGGVIWTDPVPWVIPRGTRYGIRIYRTNANGCPFTLNVQNPGIGERIEVNVGVDKTMGGTISTADAANWFGPIGIRGLMTRPSVGIIGDSISLGQGDTIDSSGALGGIARSLQAAGIAWTNLSVGGTTAQSYLAANTNKTAIASTCSHVIIAHGRNDVFLVGRSDAQLRADILSIVALLPATTKKFIATLAPDTTGTWGDLAGQTITASQSILDANNAWRRTVPTGFVGCFDINAVLQSGSTGKWRAPGYTADGVHPTALGYAAIRDSGIISAVNFTR
jgi:lysophospholipase L1-like esterase